MKYLSCAEMEISACDVGDRPTPYKGSEFALLHPNASNLRMFKVFGRSVHHLLSPASATLVIT